MNMNDPTAKRLLKPLLQRPVTSVEAPDIKEALFSRRTFLRNGSVGLASLATATQVASAATPETWHTAGQEFSNYGQAPQDTNHPIRWISANPAVPGEGVSWSPLHELEGIITPNGLHFERHHNGVPQIDASSWELPIFGEVERALSFNLETLHRYPLVSKIAFIECGGNSNSLWRPNPSQSAAGYMHGLVSCSEWTGVPLSLLLQECGLTKNAAWLVADGLDAAGVSVSLPIASLPDDTMIALYQNGEPVRPENGFPARLLVPGWEGIVNLKWLRSLHISNRPLLSKYDTVSYTDLLKDGKAERFSFEMQVKSVITSPASGDTLSDKGFYEIRGIAWTGNGKIDRVEVSADGGKSWMEANLQEPVLDRALTRFKAPWSWDGSPAILQSRAYDKLGQVQPTRDELIARKGANVYYHYNAICSWAVNPDGRISHVYA